MKPIKLSPWQNAAISWALEPMRATFSESALPRIVDGCLVLSDAPDANNELTRRIEGDLVTGLKANEIFAFPERNEEKRFEILKAQRLAGRIVEVRNRNTIRLKLGSELMNEIRRFEVEPLNDASPPEQHIFAAAVQDAGGEDAKRIVVLELGGDPARYMHSRIDRWCDTWRDEQSSHRARSNEYHQRRLWIVSCLRLKTQLAGFLGIGT